MIIVSTMNIEKIREDFPILSRTVYGVYPADLE